MNTTQVEAQWQAKICMVFEVTSGQSQSDLRIIHEHDDETTESYGTCSCS